MRATSGSARSMRAAGRPRRAAGARRLRLSKSVRRRCARAIPIWRRSGSPGGATSCAASVTRRSGRRSPSRSRSARRSTTFALPRDRLEAMLDARLQEIAPQDDFNLARLRGLSPDESEGARLRLAVADRRRRRATSTVGEAHAPGGLALALARMLSALPFEGGRGADAVSGRCRVASWGEPRTISTRAARAPA